MIKSTKLLSAIIASLFLLSAVCSVPVSAQWYKTSNNKYLYADDEGNFCTGWQTIDDELYYFDSSGYMKTGWLKTSSGQKYYMLPGGNAARSCIVKIGGVSYRFDKYCMLIEETDTYSDTAVPVSKSKTVYVTRTGKRYHSDSSCSSGIYYASTLEEAEAAGLTPCKKCIR